MNAIEQLLDRARCSGIDHFTADALALMREHLSTLEPIARIRALIPHGDSFAERAIDGVWNKLGRRPTSTEYRELARLFAEAIAYCESEANDVADDDLAANG